MKRPVIWLLLLVTLAGSGYWLYKRYAQGPEYTLYQIKKAVDARDMAALEKYVDVDLTAASFLEQTVQAGMAELPEKERAMAALFLGMAMASQKDNVMEALRQEIERYVEQGKTGQGPPAGVSQQEWNQVQALLPLQKLLEESKLADSRLGGIAYVTRQDSLATVGLKLQAPSHPKPIIVDVQMRDRDGYWQVIGLPNAGTVLKQLGLLDLWRKSLTLPKLQPRR